MESKQEKLLNKRNAELEKELARKNRDLEIESALEKVRSSALAMRVPADMLDVCRIICEQLEVLHINEIRNVQTAVFNEDKKTYTNYEYYRLYDKTFITEVEYGDHPVHNAFAKEMLTGPGLLFAYTFEGNELREWIAYQKESNQFADPHLDEVSSVNYYWFSLGPVAWGITFYAPVSEAELEIVKRFRNVFDLAYRRFADIQKAEAQAREAQIEAALERTRTQSMLMQHSTELDDTLRVFHQQVLLLGIRSAFSFLWLPDEEKDRHIFWAAWAENNSKGLNSKAIDYPLDRNEPATAQCLVDWKRNDPVVSYHVPPDGVENYFAAWQELLAGVEQLKPEFFQGGLYYVEAFMKYGCFGVMVESPLTEEEKKILGRFAVEFERTYTRFNDLKQAEEQARESQIQLALERVRAKAMAMQHSDELQEAASLLFRQVQELGIQTWSCGYNIWEKGDKTCTSWMSNKGQLQPPFKIPLTEHATFIKFRESKEKGEDFWLEELGGEKLKAQYQYLLSLPGVEGVADKNAQAGLSFPEFQINHFANFSHGNLLFITYKPAPEAHDIFKRFAAVFEQTYTRFLDLQKAEAQIKEAQIEAALEKVRSRSLAMHQTDELREVVSVVFEKLHDLEIVMEGEAASIVIFTEGTKDLILWNAIPGQSYSMSFHIPYHDTVVISSLLEARGMDFYSRAYTFEEKNSHWKWALEHSDYKYLPEDRKQFILASEHFACSVAYTKNSAILVSSYVGKLLSEKEAEILKRFARVFEQAYVRFLDLHKAEIQAREAQIELSLERVRAKTMAMHTSEHVGETVATMFDELVKLGIEKTVRCGILIIDETKHMEVWTAAYNAKGKVDMLIGRIDMMIHPLISNIHEAWKNKEQVKTYELLGKDLKAYYKAVNDSPEYPVQFDLASLPAKQTNNAFFFAEGAIFAFTLEPLSADEVKLFKRFAGVFGQTYRRYLDLQKAEAQARAAIKQASVDRVRGEIASMRTTNDLERITPLIWNELTILGIPFIRCGVFIVDEEDQLIHTHLSTSEGNALATFDLTFESDGIGRDILPAWRNKQIATVHWSAGEFATYTKNLVEQGTVASGERYVTEHPDTSLDLHFFPFLQGMLYVGNVAPLTDDEKDLVQSLADAFSTAYARYEDFNKLEAAKQQVENTLTDLKATQTKLIQSEKMASLGELTAGIAHEIQNPLNFVNNFSEVNQEMIEELEEELKAGNIDEALALAADIKGNEQKINHHGKRADGIVKGMLAHSRTGGGEKQPTNINALADEFLRLSYHGLRAKDKTFNAELITHFDPQLPKVNVIPQDIGRVMLNLFNNAFYAVNQKMKASIPGYKPEVSVITGVENGQVLIKVRDNGIGMPEHIKEKIMQPFFTTKPAGEGTGLGLSLTYDMVVKGHGGSIRVNSVEGEGSEFIISLPLN